MPTFSKVMVSKSAQEIKDAFPIFNGALKGWAYLDNAATTQKPEPVIQAISDFYRNANANIHRGLYDLSSQATRQFEEVRKKVASFIGAAHESEIAFTSGTTESINLVANSFRSFLKEGDEIIISAMEHHSNLIPWQQLCFQSRAVLKILGVTSQGELSLAQLNSLITPKSKLIAVVHISNTLGTINPIEEIVNTAHRKGVPVLIDAAQSAGHYPLNVSKLDVDFLAFSAHKMFGPMGTGALYANVRHHKMIRPLEFGGGSIKWVSFSETRHRDYPFCVEAGTPNVPGVIGLGAAIDFLNTLNLNEVGDHAHHLASQLRDRLKSLPFIKLMGSPEKHSGIVSFSVDGIHAHDVASFLADNKIAVRAGHHCTQPLHDLLGIPASVRVSFSIYNSEEEVERVLDSLVELKNFWS